MQAAATQMAGQSRNQSAQPEKEICHPKDKQSFCPAVPGVKRQILISRRGPWRLHAFPIAHVLSVVSLVRRTAGGCAGSSHSLTEEKQVHAGAAVESRRCGGAQKA